MSGGNCSVGHFADNSTVPLESLRMKHRWNWLIYGGKTVEVGLPMGKDSGWRGCYRPRKSPTAQFSLNQRLIVLSVASSGLQLHSFAHLS